MMNELGIAGTWEFPHNTERPEETFGLGSDEAQLSHLVQNSFSPDTGNQFLPVRWL